MSFRPPPPLVQEPVAIVTGDPIFYDSQGNVIPDPTPPPQPPPTPETPPAEDPAPSDA